MHRVNERSLARCFKMESAQFICASECVVSIWSLFLDALKKKSEAHQQCSLFACANRSQRANSIRSSQSRHVPCELETHFQVRFKRRLQTSFETAGRPIKQGPGSFALQSHTNAFSTAQNTTLQQLYAHRHRHTHTHKMLSLAAIILTFRDVTP